MTRDKATGKISANFEFNRYGDFTGIVHLNAENEKDQMVLQRGISRLLRRWNLTLRKVVYERSAR